MFNDARQGVPEIDRESGNGMPTDNPGVEDPATQVRQKRAPSWDPSHSWRSRSTDKP
jgi:hypothetical protein